MSPAGTAIRAGWRGGRIELRQSFTNPAEQWGHFFWPGLMVAVTFFLRDVSFAGFGLATLALPGILGMNASMAMVSMSQQLTAEREDGTLLRAKATPNGLLGHLVAKVVAVSGGLLADLAIFLVPAALIVPGLAGGGLSSWLTVAWALALGLVATLPVGAVLGSVFGSARGQAVLTLPILAVIAISGVFYPIVALPGWLQGIAQVFPIYWLGLAMRSALLPAGAVTLELGDSWRHGETVAVLVVWAVAGLVLAPILLRRLARRESGSAVTARRAA